MLTRRGARRLLLALALPLILVAGMPDRATADDTYTPTLPTSCRVEAAATQARQAVVLRVEVTTNDTASVRGAVHLAIDRLGPKRTVWRRTVRYDGAPLRVTGPRLPRGRYEARMVFVPDSNEYDGCRASVRLGDRPAQDPDDDGASGVLPDTGGPRLWLLLAGVALLASGGVLTGRSSRVRVA